MPGRLRRVLNAPVRNDLEMAALVLQPVALVLYFVRRYFVVVDPEPEWVQTLALHIYFWMTTAAFWLLLFSRDRDMDWMGFSPDVSDEEALTLAGQRFGTERLELRRTRAVVLVRPRREEGVWAETEELDSSGESVAFR